MKTDFLWKSWTMLDILDIGQFQDRRLASERFLQPFTCSILGIFHRRRKISAIWAAGNAISVMEKRYNLAPRLARRSEHPYPGQISCKIMHNHASSPQNHAWPSFHAKSRMISANLANSCMRHAWSCEILHDETWSCEILRDVFFMRNHAWFRKIFHDFAWLHDCAHGIIWFFWKLGCLLTGKSCTLVNFIFHVFLSFLRFDHWFFF